MVTISDVAKYCGVSVATVSHVLNRTRFVEPKTIRLVMDAVEQLGYQPLRSSAAQSVSDSKSIGFVVNRNLLTACGCRSFVRMAENSRWITLASDNEITEYQVNTLKKKYCLDRMLIHSSVQIIYDKKRKSDLQDIILLNQPTPPKETTPQILWMDYPEAVKTALRHLIRCGHQNIRLWVGGLNDYTLEKIIESSIAFTAESGIFLQREHFISFTDPYYTPEDFASSLPCSALICVGTLPMMAFLRYRNMHPLQIPQDLSVVAIDDDNFVRDYLPDFTAVNLDPTVLHPVLVEDVHPAYPDVTSALPVLVIRNSSRFLPHNPQGIPAADPSSMELSYTQSELLRRKKHRIGVLFADGRTVFSQLVQQGLLEYASYNNIEIISVLDAWNSSDRMRLQLDQLWEQSPDLIISIANNHAPMVESFICLAHNSRIPLLLGSNLPSELPDNAYVSCIATNDAEKGRLAAKLLADTMNEKHRERVILINSDDAYYSSLLCDRSFYQTLESEYPEIQVCQQFNGLHPENFSAEFASILARFPDVPGFYIHNASMAMDAERFLQQQGITDRILVTSQINSFVANQMLQQPSTNLIGFCSSPPYQIGRHLATAAAAILLHKPIPKYITVDPVLVVRDNLETCWHQLTLQRL